MKFRVARALDYHHTVHWLLEHLLECRGDCFRNHVPSSDHWFFGTETPALAPGRKCRSLR
jgi:hypothetical protein